MEKKGLILTSLLFLINFVSSYGGSSGLLVGNYYLDIDLIISVGIFMTIFIVLSLATRKMNLFHTEGARIFVSFIIALFSIYGLSKTKISYEALFIDWGIQNILMDYGAWILILFFLIIVWIYNLRVFIAIAAGAFFAMGITGMFSEDIIYNWELSFIIGTGLLLFFLWLRKRGGFKFGKVKIIKGMPILSVVVNGDEKKHSDGEHFDIPLGYRQIAKMYIKNNGEGDMEWKIHRARGLRFNKRNGVLGKSMYSAIGVKNIADDGHPKEFVIYAKGPHEKKKKTQHTTIRILPPTSGSRPQTPQQNPRQSRERLKIQEQYNKYSNRIQTIVRKYNRKIPGNNSTATSEERKDSREYSSLTSAMKKLEKIARKNGLTLR